MSRARHTAKYGKNDTLGTAYSGGDSNVVKEAKERKKGGAVMGEGCEPKGRKDRKRATGGAVSAATPARATGGAVGANKRPLSTAASVKKLPGEM